MFRKSVAGPQKRRGAVGCSFRRVIL